MFITAICVLFLVKQLNMLKEEFPWSEVYLMVRKVRTSREKNLIFFTKLTPLLPH